MTQKEKAKAYDKVREKIAIRFGSNVADEIFSQFEMSDDERIRKAIIKMIANIAGGFPFETYGIIKKEALAWLEKQGNYNRLVEEMKDRKELLSKEKEKATSPNDKLSLGGRIAILEELLAFTKEKQGDKSDIGISSATKQKLKDSLNKALQKETGESWDEFLDEQKHDKVEPKFREGEWIVDNNGIVKQILSYKNGVYKHTHGYSAKILENEWRMWTIQDAKDGDVLAAHECYVIFKEIDGLNIKCYCTYHFMNNPSFYVDTLQNKTAFYPATKEQRDTLMKAMADAGYTFYFEKKELKKIEHTPAWSEEDERTSNKIQCLIGIYRTGDSEHKLCSWIDNLKYRVQPKQEWSEEDEKMYRGLHNLIYSTPYCDSRKELSDFLDSLKNRLQSNHSGLRTE